MNVWFYAQNDERKGPISQDDLLAKFSSGELTPQSLVWRKGMPEWLPAAQTEGLLEGQGGTTVTATAEVPMPTLRSAAPTAQMAEASARTGETAAPTGPQVFLPTVTVGPIGAVPTLEARPVAWKAPEAELAQTALGGTGSQRRPWPRYFARSLDTVFVGVTFGTLAVLAGQEDLLESKFLNGLVIALALCFVEAALLSSWGTTPGKWLFNIRVSRTNGRLLTFGQALKRAFGVFFYGEGLGFPIITLFTQATAYNKLVNEGTTKWDEGVDQVVTHRDLDTGKMIMSVLLLMGTFALIVLGAAAG